MAFLGNVLKHHTYLTTKSMYEFFLLACQPKDELSSASKLGNESNDQHRIQYEEVSETRELTVMSTVKFTVLHP